MYEYYLCVKLSRHQLLSLSLLNLRKHIMYIPSLLRVTFTDSENQLSKLEAPLEHLVIAVLHIPSGMYACMYINTVGELIR